MPVSQEAAARHCQQPHHPGTAGSALPNRGLAAPALSSISTAQCAQAGCAVTVIAAMGIEAAGLHCGQWALALQCWTFAW